jgi:hypothetical protein
MCVRLMRVVRVMRVMRVPPATTPTPTPTVEVFVYKQLSHMLTSLVQMRLTVRIELEGDGKRDERGYEDGDSFASSPSVRHGCRSLDPAECQCEQQEQSRPRWACPRKCPAVESADCVCGGRALRTRLRAPLTRGHPPRSCGRAHRGRRRAAVLEAEGLDKRCGGRPLCPGVRACSCMPGAHKSPCMATAGRSSALLL